MFEILRKFYRSISLLTKIRMIIISVTLTVMIIILSFSFYFYSSLSQERELANAQASVAQASFNFNLNTKDILERFVDIGSSQDFLKDLTEIRDNPLAVKAHGQILQDDLDEFSYSGYLVHSALILTGDQTQAYSLYRSPLRVTTQVLFPDNELTFSHGITFLAERNSPFNPSIDVLPLVIPVSIYDTYVQVDNGEHPPLIYVVLYLDKNKIEMSLNHATAQGSDNTYYIINGSGNLLSAIGSGHSLENFPNPRASDLISTMRKNGGEHLALSEENTHWILYELERNNLLLLSEVPQITFTQIVGRAGYALALTLLLFVLLILALSFFTSNYVTKPVLKLVDVVHLIEQNEYRKKVRFETNDEVGQLLAAINGMYDTIQNQMITIKEEEAQKYKMELKLLTEQINPHFLYNTLEEIQSEVLRGDSKVASNMIQYLAEFLRIGLSGGADAIPIKNELRHANAYVKIMNQRFRQSILFMHKIDPALNDCLIIKTILQPLIENSIRHGFGIDSPGIPVSVPTIEIVFSAPQTGILKIEVVDNGSGFDTEQVHKLMTDQVQNDTSHPVGLNNVFHRLAAHYGLENVELQLESIPYYRNAISFIIHTNF